MDDLTKCGACGFEGTLDDFDIMGACPGNLFCNECNAEFDASTGKPALLCGVCQGCKWLKDDGEWEDAQIERLLARKGDQAMKPYQQQVIDEKRELDEKAKKLSEFIGTNPVFATVDDEEQERLKEQCEIMWQYSEILCRRIAAFIS